MSNTVYYSVVINRWLSLTFIIAHMMACAWGMAATNNDDMRHNWMTGDDHVYNRGPTAAYLAALYWAITTMTTVGSVRSTDERERVDEEWRG